MQAPLLMGEQVLGRYASKAGLPPLPLVLRILLTLALLEAGGYYLFFAAVEVNVCACGGGPGVHVCAARTHVHAAQGV